MAAYTYGIGAAPRKSKAEELKKLTDYRIVLNSRPGVYFLPEVLDPALIRDWRLIEAGIN